MSFNEVAMHSFTKSFVSSLPLSSVNFIIANLPEARATANSSFSSRLDETR